MNQKERTIFVTIALLKVGTKKETLIDKLRTCFQLMRPEVLLDDKGRKIYEQEIKKAKLKGQIP